MKQSNQAVERLHYPLSSDDDKIIDAVLGVAELALPAHRSL